MEMLEMFWRRSHLHHLLPSSQPNFLASAALGLSPSAYSHLSRCKKHWAWLAVMVSMVGMVSIVSMMNKVSMVSMVRMGSLLELFMLPHTMKYLGFDQCLILRTQISPVTLFSNPGRSLRLKWENHYFPMCLENRWVWHLFQKVDRISRFWPLLAIFISQFSLLCSFGLLQSFLCYSSPLSSWPQVAEWVSITQWHKNGCSNSSVRYNMFAGGLYISHTTYFMYPLYIFIRPSSDHSLTLSATNSLTKIWNLPNQTRPNLPNQTYQTKHTKPNLPNQTYHPNLAKQTYQTKTNLPNKT